MAPSGTLPASPVHQFSIARHGLKYDTGRARRISAKVERHVHPHAERCSGESSNKSAGLCKFFDTSACMLHKKRRNRG